MDDLHNLARFVDAQAPLYGQVLDELRAGRKRSHWIWLVFPQIAGLGHSAMAQRYAIASLGEAQAYLAHPVLGARLRECSALVLAVQDRPVHDIFGSPDDMKFRSCMTLFASAGDGSGVFGQCLEKYFGGQPDPLTLELL
ncbi:DUF1810 domain-containing protein [Ramlibacter sp. WS9]|uniref:DUF1810 domain-containing protein n=1 Tax=Ramlibacter sp. WS9 TaxID=1882741 RepID=UPI001143E375|nr:DUF1810 domain-containing protein [Ramlibacter sp. WS9]ROZ79052.1 DUF1810 domain-containing protein [Ramlibacter sp. WS9]